MCIVGGGMVGTATALRLADKGIAGVCVVCAKSNGLPSSSADVSRLLGTGGAADNLSIRGFPELQERSGIHFWHEVGLLEVTPAAHHLVDPPSARSIGDPPSERHTDSRGRRCVRGWARRGAGAVSGRFAPSCCVNGEVAAG